MSKLQNFLSASKILLRGIPHPRVVAIIVLGIILFLPVYLNAQDQDYFLANGNEIDIQSLNRDIKKMMDDMGIPGMSLAVISNDKIVFYNAYGVKRLGGKEKVDKNTVFNGCSLSKSLLVYVAHQLVDEGKLELDRPLYKYMLNKSLEHDSRYKQITPRMVLSHSSGLENWQHHNQRDTLEIIADPGTEHTYSGEGYHYLSAIMEKILEQSYEEFITERVINSLNLKNTYLKYTEPKAGSETGGFPENYAVGHQLVGKQNTWKNLKTVPAGGNHFTAEDYAKLIISIFNEDNFSPETRANIQEKTMIIDGSEVFYGPGFEVGTVDGDTIIGQGGDSDGYKNMILYSTTKKAGFVFLTNVDWGKGMMRKLSELTVGLNVEPFIVAQYALAQYPSKAYPLLKIANEKGYDVFLEGLEKIEVEEQLDLGTLSYLGYMIRYYGDLEVARKVLLKTTKMYPDAPLAYDLLAEYYMDKQKYKEAHKYYMKAKDLNFSDWDIEKEIRFCERKLIETEKRKEYLVKINDNEETTVEAENYNTWEGVVKVSAESDKGKGAEVRSFGKGDRMDYKIEIAQSGNYLLTFRVASPKEDNRLEVHLGTKTIAKLDVKPTGGWGNWMSFSTNVQLPAGNQTLKLYALEGNYRINWVKFSPLKGKDQ